jgi:hypothetical protein
MWDTTEDWRGNVREFVKNGGGVLFSHNAVGRIPSSAFGKPLFPGICLGYDGQLVGKPTLEAIEAHPAVGMEKGAQIQHEYNDHLYIKPGAEGKVLLNNDMGKPVMVAGSSGKGRAVYTGQIFGMNKKDEQKESKGDEWKLLYNSVVWLSKN